MRGVCMCAHICAHGTFLSLPNELLTPSSRCRYLVTTLQQCWGRGKKKRRQEREGGVLAADTSCRGSVMLAH